MNGDVTDVGSEVAIEVEVEVEVRSMEVAGSGDPERSHRLAVQGADRWRPTG